MDLRLTSRDLDITNGDLSFVSGLDAIAQDIAMALQTWLGESVYDRNAGVPWLQVIFKRGTRPDAARFILENIIRGIDGVQDVLEINASLASATRVLTVAARVRALDAEFPIAVEVSTP